MLSEQHSLVVSNSVIAAAALTMQMNDPVMHSASLVVASSQARPGQAGSKGAPHLFKDTAAAATNDGDINCTVRARGAAAKTYRC